LVSLTLGRYNRTMHRMDGYLTHDGEVNLPRLEMFMLELGGLEDTILAQRRIKDQRDRERRKREKEYAARRRGEPSPAAPSRPAGVDVYPVGYNDNFAYFVVHLMPPLQVTSPPPKRQNSGFGSSPASSSAVPQLANIPHASNYAAAAFLRSALLAAPSVAAAASAPPATPTHAAAKESTPGSLSRSNSGLARSGSGIILDEDDEPLDDVRLGEAGWKQRYYKNKFGADSLEEQESCCKEYAAPQMLSPIIAKWILQDQQEVCGGPMLGAQVLLSRMLLLALVPAVSMPFASFFVFFVLRFYPYHYAPFSGDMEGIGKLQLSFELGTPFRPMEQLMCVLPTASKQFLPVAFQRLMEDPDSPLIKYAPLLNSMS
jgi:5'-3' exoribonuclease 2